MGWLVRAGPARLAQEPDVHVDGEGGEGEPLQAVAEVAPDDAALAEDRRRDAHDGRVGQGRLLVDEEDEG